MAKSIAPPSRLWDTFAYQGRPFFSFPVQVREGGSTRVTVPRQIADRYDVRDVLARGGGGLILVASDLRTGNDVLVKALAEYHTVQEDLAVAAEDFTESLRRDRHHLQTERRILVQLRRRGTGAVPHPNDYVFDANPQLAGPHRTLDGQSWTFDDHALIASEPYLVMQRVEGTSLQELLKTTYARGIAEPAALQVIDQVARVLELLQEPFRMRNGQTWELVYQDLKPGNILLDGRGRATVLDFGGCQLVIDGTLVLHGSHSTGYCAPECGVSPDPIGPSADTYALGSTLFHMLSGFNPRRLLPKQLDPDAPRAAKIDAGALAGRCSPGVVALIAKSVDWDVRARFQTVRDFRAAIAPVLEAA